MKGVLCPGSSEQMGSFNSCDKRGKHDSIKKRVRCIMWMTPDRLFVHSILIPLDCVIEIRLYDRVNQDSIIRSSKSRFDYTSNIVVRLDPSDYTFYVSILLYTIVVGSIRSLSSNQRVITKRLVPSDESPYCCRKLSQGDWYLARSRHCCCRQCCWQIKWCKSFRYSLPII